jgi:hypothetical protein
LEKLFILPFVVLFILIYHDIDKIMQRSTEMRERKKYVLSLPEGTAS